VVGGTLLLLRCFIAGATRFGMRPIRTVAWWQRAWTALGGDTVLPPFLPNPLWEELCAEAERITVTPAPGTDTDDDATDLSGLTMTHFEALAPALTITGLDEEFVESWKRWVTVAPNRLARALLEGLDDACAEVTLYPDGGGGVHLKVESGGVCVGLLELGFSFPNDEFTLDEIRITGAGKGTGLFQRLMFNTERAAAVLGFSQVHALATGIGSYALAALGYPKSREFPSVPPEAVAGWRRPSATPLGPRARRKPAADADPPWPLTRPPAPSQ
jgi:hypothetical protein